MNFLFIYGLIIFANSPLYAMQEDYPDIRKPGRIAPSRKQLWENAPPQSSQQVLSPRTQVEKEEIKVISHVLRFEGVDVASNQEQQLPISKKIHKKRSLKKAESHRILGDKNEKKKKKKSSRKRSLSHSEKPIKKSLKKALSQRAFSDENNWQEISLKNLEHLEASLKLREDSVTLSEKFAESREELLSKAEKSLHISPRKIMEEEFSSSREELHPLKGEKEISSQTRPPTPRPPLKPLQKKGKEGDKRERNACAELILSQPPPSKKTRSPRNREKEAEDPPHMTIESYLSREQAFIKDKLWEENFREEFLQISELEKDLELLNNNSPNDSSKSKKELKKEEKDFQAKKKELEEKLAKNRKTFAAKYPLLRESVKNELKMKDLGIP